jgi:hypothetical protein
MSDIRMSRRQMLALLGIMPLRFDMVTAQGDTLTPENASATSGLSVIIPKVQMLAAPLRPTVDPPQEQSVLLGHSYYMAPGDGTGDVTPPYYQPIRDGGFSITNGHRTFNRPIVHGQNRVWTGDVPIFRMDTVTGNGVYVEDRVFPLWPRPDAAAGNVNPRMGTLRLGIVGADDQTHWLDEWANVAATVRPGYTQYQLSDPAVTATASVIIAPSLDAHGLVCHIEFDQPTRLCWQYGGMWWKEQEKNANSLTFQTTPYGTTAQITEPNLPNGLVACGGIGDWETKTLAASYGQQAQFTASAPQRSYDIAATWGVTQYDTARAKTTMARLDTPAAAAWSQERDRLKQSWFDCYIGRALDPEARHDALLAAPEQALHQTQHWWDTRRAEFQIRTPDLHLDALINWTRCISEYHRQGPGLVLGGQIWQNYAHISTGWYGKEWGGDHAIVADTLRLYAAMQGKDGFVNWVAPSLAVQSAEDNNPYWVDQVWQHYLWTGDKQFVHDLWPGVKAAVAWMQKHNDPDGDGLFRDAYEYWNCDSNGKGPKAAAPSALSWAMFDRAARLAAVVGDTASEHEYRVQEQKTHTRIFHELWHEEGGRLGSIGADGLWCGHPQTWEEFLAINYGLLTPEQGRRAMRWVESHYGFSPHPDIHLLMCSDWWPIRWSVQWVPTGDTCLAALAGMKSGDTDLWWPYVQTVVGSSFRSEFSGINLGIANSGAGGGDRENVDGDDPHVQLILRGLFGLTPALDTGSLEICPAFPTSWKEASLHTPDVSYEYRREGDHATFKIHTPRALAKHVRANLTGLETVTQAGTHAVVTVPLGPAVALPGPVTHPPTILADRQPPKPSPALTPEAQVRQVLFDLSEATNQTLEEFTATSYIFDNADTPQPLTSWWGNPALVMPPSPRLVKTSTGISFLTAGNSSQDHTPKDLLALSSWRPYPLPGGVVIPVGFRCGRLFLLMQNYVHPMKNYLVNGEIVLKYADGTQSVTALVPPFNLDCYFQRFSREGVTVPFGTLAPFGPSWTPIAEALAVAQANALEVACDPSRSLNSVTLRATCSEGILGLAGLTALRL